MNTYPQGGPKQSNSMAKVQKTCLVWLSHFQPSSCFQPVHKPGFVHLITWPSNGYDWDAGGLSLRCVVSNKTSYKSFGGHLLSQISRWSQMLKTVSVLPSSENGSVWTPKAPPLGLKLLWLESTLKILSSGHKKTQPNYTLKELLTRKLGEENPFYPGYKQSAVLLSFEVICFNQITNPLANDLIRVPSCSLRSPKLPRSTPKPQDQQWRCVKPRFNLTVFGVVLISKL